MFDQSRVNIVTPGKICLGTLDCRVSLKQVTYSNYSQSQIITPPLLCAFDTQLRVTHPLLELSLGCLEKQSLTASPLPFEWPQWLEYSSPYSSENFSRHLLANSLRYQAKSENFSGHLLANSLRYIYTTA